MAHPMDSFKAHTVVPIGLSLIFKFNFSFCVLLFYQFLCICDAHKGTWCPWRPEMGIRFPGTYTTGSCKFMSV